MKCKHLKKLYITVCRVSEELYVPIVFQLKEYCVTKGHRRCPLFMKRERRSECTAQLS